MVHHGQAVAHRQRFLLIVGDVHERDADVAVQGTQFDLQRLAQLGVEGAEWLVEQQHLGSQHEGPGQGDALLLTAGQLMSLAALETVESHQLECIADSLGHLGLAGLLEAQPERRRCRQR